MIFTGSLASSDLFYDAFHHKGLTREALCPCAGSPETLTVSVRRCVILSNMQRVDGFLPFPLHIFSSSLFVLLSGVQVCRPYGLTLECPHAPALAIYFLP